MKIKKAIEDLKERVIFMEDFLKEKESMGTIVLDKEKILNSIALNKLSIIALEKQLNGGWIPVSERLPSEEECNRFDIRHSNRRKFLCTVKIGDYEPQVRELYFNLFYQWEYYSENYDKYVTAWQPLPEPYKEESFDGKDYL